jgi:hypothetical protein
MSSSRAVEIIRVAISPLNFLSAKQNTEREILNLPVSDQETPYWPLCLGCHCESYWNHRLSTVSSADVCHLGAEIL